MVPGLVVCTFEGSRFGSRRTTLLFSHLIVVLRGGRMSCAWTEGRSCLRELVLPEAKLFFGVFRRQPVLDVPSASAPGQGSGFSFTADPGRARALDDWSF